jgi:glycosyltransferase involved in cell wall biosynthesis
LFTTKKIAFVSVINDLVTDNRVNKTGMVLIECGYDVVLVGRKFSNSLPIPNWSFKTIRFKMIFKKGPVFYFFFNLRLFFVGLINKTDLFYANDLDTLAPLFLLSKLKKKPLIYDSHELFCEVPELKDSKIKKAIWQKLEGYIIPKLKTCITVNDSIAKIYEAKYNVPFYIIRNISDFDQSFIPQSRAQLSMPEDKKIILLQGAGINVDRGAEELIDAMEFVQNAVLYIIGSGDVWDNLKQKVSFNKNIQNKVVLINKLPKSELINYTFNADIGLSIDKNTNLNYLYSLPNKIFDYIQAEIPILASRLPEIENIILQYKIGDFIDDHNPKTIANKLNEMLYSQQLSSYKKYLAIAKKEITWKSEKEKLLTIIKNI